MERYEEILSKLESAVGKDEFYELEEKAAAELESAYPADEIVEPVLLFMEKFPLGDFGMPGALTHLIETANKDLYEKLLLGSIGRTPTMHTLWLLNRVINGVSGEKKEQYVSVMQSVADNENIRREIRDEAKDYTDYQNKAGQKPQTHADSPFGSLEDIFKAFNIIPKDK